MAKQIITVPSLEHADEIIEALQQRRVAIQQVVDKFVGLAIGETAKEKLKRIDACLVAVDNADEK